MVGRDRINELPAGIRDKILGYLPIEEAARTAVLSTAWKNIWSSLTRLNFGDDFFGYNQIKYSNSYNFISPSFYVINKVLMQHSGPIQKFVFEFSDWSIYSSRSFRQWFYFFDQWLLLVTQNGVQEIDLCLEAKPYRLPNCIFSCATLKRLHLALDTLEPINAPCILPNVTSLCFERVDFGSRVLDCAAQVPMLEDLSFIICNNTFNCNISAPKLCSFSITFEEFDYEPGAILPVNLDLRSVSTMKTDFTLEDIVKQVRSRGPQPLVLNLEYLQLTCFDTRYDGSGLIDLLQICPQLSQIDMIVWEDDVEHIWKFLEELPSVAQTLKQLRTLKLDGFHGYESEMLIVQTMLACCPTLEKVVLRRCSKGRVDNECGELIEQELLRFLCGFPKAQIVYI